MQKQPLKKWPPYAVAQSFGTAVVHLYLYSTCKHFHSSNLLKSKTAQKEIEPSVMAEQVQEQMTWESGLRQKGSCN